MKNIKLPKSIKISALLKVTTRYLYMIIFIIFSIMIGIIVQSAGEAAYNEPTASEIQDKVKNLQAKKVDQESLNKLKELQEQSVSIEALFDNGRTNPFEN